MESEPESESIRSPESDPESESEQPHHDSAPLIESVCGKVAMGAGGGGLHQNEDRFYKGYGWFGACYMSVAAV